MSRLSSAASLAACGVLFALAAPHSAKALSIETTSDALSLAQVLLLNSGGVTIDGTPRFSGSFGQAGIYSNTTGTYGMPTTGIVLSTGNVANYAAGPNTESGFSTSYTNDGEGEGGDGGDGGDGGGCEPDQDFVCDLPGDGDGDIAVIQASIFEGDAPQIDVPGEFTITALATSDQQTILEGITGQTRFFDIAQLTIDFFADTDEVIFFATFGSEEFPEFTESEFVDGFGLLINGLNVASAAGLPINIAHPDFVARAGTELDGVLAPGGNAVMQFRVPVTRGVVNTFDIIIADATDSVFDTTVYLSSFFGTSVADDSTGPTGANEFDPLLPPTNGGFDEETGVFTIFLPEILDPETTIWIDPPVAVGYTYSVSGGLFVDSITAPSNATVPDLDGYLISANGFSAALAPGGVLSASEIDLIFGGPLAQFDLTGIDESLMLDPSDPTEFPLGISFTGPVTSGTVTITPIVVDVDPSTSNPTVSPIPLPAGAPLYLTVIGLAALVRRRMKKASA